MTMSTRSLASLLALALAACAGKGSDTPAPAPAPEPAPVEAAEPEPEPAEGAGDEAEPEPEPAKAAGNLLETIQKSGQGSKFLEAMDKAGLNKHLTGTEEEVTVILPTDAAWENMPAAIKAKMNKPEEAAKILKYHLLPDKMDLNRVMMHRSLPTLAGPEIPVQVIEGTTLKFDKANLVEGNIEASNGMVHVIDQVLIPKK